MSLVGYARVSTRDQDPSAQIKELETAGAIKVFVDHGESSRIKNRPALIECFNYLRAGDTLLVRRLDRLAGSEKMAIEILNDLANNGINIKSLSEPDIDTTTPMGRALFGIVAVFAQLRIDTIRENTLKGLAYARSQGRIGGRPSVMNKEKLEAAKTLRAQGMSNQAIGKLLGVSEPTIRRHLKQLENSNI